MKFIALAYLLFMTHLVSANVASMPTVQASHDVKSIWTGAHYLLDEDLSLDAKDIILSPLSNSQAPQSTPNLGIIDGQVWVWFKLKPLEDQATELQIGFPHLTLLSVDIFSELGDPLLSLEDVASLPFSEQKNPSQFINVSLPRSNESMVVVLKIRSEYPLRLPISIGPEKSFVQNQIATTAVVFLLLGVLFALCIYNFTLYLTTSLPHYLFYCLSLIFLLLFFFIDLGLFRYVFPKTYWLNTVQAWGVSVCLAFMFAILFAKTFLRLAYDYLSWNRWFLFLVSSVVIVIALILLDVNKIALSSYLVVSGLYQISVIVISIKVLKNGYKPARFFLLAWIFLAIGGVTYQLTITGKIPVNLFTEHAFLIGSVVESLLLSWALAEWIGKLQMDQVANERHYQKILNKTGNRLAYALQSAAKHKKVRDVFLRGISHELKTPLHSIQHVVDLLLQGYHINSELIHDANHSTRLISRHVDKLLLNTEMDDNDFSFTQEKVDIKPALKLWHQDLYSECKEKNTEFSLNTNLVDWDTLAGATRPVYLLLTDVVFNAANTSVESIILNCDISKNTGQLHIHLDMKNDTDDSIKAIDDIFQSEQDSIFIDNIITMLGGHWNIQFDSPVILIDIYLPGFEVARKERGDSLPDRVLVVEDNEINQKVMKSMLARIGVECEIAINGDDALNKQALNPVDIILMDCQMPMMDGFETTSIIRSNAQRYHRPIIIAVSANTMELDKAHCLTVGMNDFIAKPVRMQDLRDVLMRWGERKN